jgi:4-hydroxyphenylpyruvate dioxygenase-like putative hemolysin
VVSRQEQSGVELLLEPMEFEPARHYQQALKEASIPWTSFSVDDAQQEYERLIALGVEYSIEPREAGNVMIAVLDETCGNYIQLVQILQPLPSKLNLEPYTQKQQTSGLLVTKIYQLESHQLKSSYFD